MAWEDIDVSATASMPQEAALTTDAAAIKTRITTFKGHIVDIHTSWNGLAGIYQAPAQDQVLSAMNAPKTAAEDLVDSGTAVKKALQDFATTLGGLHTTRTTLLADIADAKALYGDDDDSLAGPLVHASLVIRANGLASDYTAAQKTCADALTAVGRVSTDTTSHYAPGILDLVSNDAERLQRDASGQKSTPAQIRAYYAYLAQMTPEQIATYAREHPEAMVYGPRNSMPAREQVDFWTGLSPAQQAAIVASLPIIAGNTEGVRYAQRAASNRRVLDLMRSGRFPVTEAQRKAYDSIFESLKPPSDSDPERHLVSFDPSTDKPLAGVAIGNVDGASQVTFNASGITSSTQGMTGEVDNAQALWDEQLRYTGGTHAVIAWIGYDSPGGFPASTEVNYTDKARVGGDELATQLDGLHLTRGQDGGNVPRVNVGAHSYGTTMATYALTQTEFDVDSVYYYGSAGVDPNVADHASDLHVKDSPNGRPAVYASQATGDLIAPGGIFSSQFGDVARVSPTDDAFGAQVLDAETSVDEYGNPLKDTTGHSGHGNYDRAPVAVDPTDISQLIDLAKGEASELIETETGHGYLDRGTTSLHHYAQITSGQTEGLEVKDQAITDTIIENKKEELHDLLTTPTRIVDGAQRGVNVSVDGGQSTLDDLQDSAVDTVNSGIDGGQDAIDSAGDAGKSVLSGAADTVREHLPFGIGDSDAVTSVQDTAEDLAGGAYDRGMGLVNGGVDLAQDGGNLLSDLVSGTRNAPVDLLQGAGNEAVDSTQRAVGAVTDAAGQKVEDEIRHYSATHRDAPTR